MPASAALIERWKASGHRITERVVAGPPFWSATEIEEAPALIEATSALTCREPVAEGTA